ncbi:hypothetical protein BDP27DRAFT_1207910 [Rhodocollybia butyracea]|uniref:Uncharacterized protein n=1 Tax=Rhodocollybia butyracea TaxID=206335 RepID=A0A9P5UFD9_9AGAR|nr:hypothetical protein BDP27DRAFT_1207910 [Rhodocollybia butyracea]
MNSPTFDRSIFDWDEDDVQNWLTGLGYPQYESQIKTHRISGDILCMLDAETLKSIGVTTIGQRLAILKAVYLLKIANNIPLDSESYVPPSEAQDRSENMTVEKLHGLVKEQSERLRSLEEENRNLNSTLQSFLDDYNTLRQSFVSRSDDPSPSLRRQASFKWAQFKPTKSPTKPEHVESPQPSPQQLDHDIPPYTRNTPSSQLASTSALNDRAKGQSSVTDSPNLSQASKPTRQDSSDNLKSFKVSLEDPTWKVLPAALKKYRINNDNWENYAMFICYGSPGNRIERCLSYDEKPLLLFQKLKDAKKNPVFMLKHIKDIRSPIVVAQQKHAARKASSIMNGGNEQPSNSTSATGTSTGHTKASSRTIIRPPKLEVNDISAPAPLTSSGVGGLSPQPKWPEPGIASPLIDAQRRVGDGGGDDSLLGIPPTSAGTLTPHGSMSTISSSLTLIGQSDAGSGSGKARLPTSDSPPLSSGREMPVASAGVSYAVAIYPYMAEQEDEFDVVVGDTFVILSRAKGWWVVQRDPNGTGLVDTDVAKQGWVPAGCLLETNVPVASAIAEANAAKSATGSASGPDAPMSKTPILPLSIISTSFPGIALMDYKKKGDEELDLAKDDVLRVFKRYNHWSYAKDGGDRGWVPSWFIGKVAAVPPTPVTSIPPQMNNSLSLEDSNGQPQVSPLSSAFPPVQSRTTTVI